MKQQPRRGNKKIYPVCDRKDANLEIGKKENVIIVMLYGY
jgi:hypothetical protein